MAVLATRYKILILQYTFPSPQLERRSSGCRRDNEVFDIDHVDEFDKVLVFLIW